MDATFVFVEEAEGSSTKGVNEEPPLEVGPSVGAGDSASPSPSTNGTKDRDEPPATNARFVFPFCFNTEPPIFFTSGTFSLILTFRPSRLSHSLPCVSPLSAPVGSTNICMRPFDDDDAGRLVERGVASTMPFPPSGLRTETGGLDGVVGASGAGSGILGEDIILF